MANVVLHKNKEARVYSGHPWVFRSDIARVEGDFTPGDIVSVYSSKGKFLAKAFYNPQSQISLRIMSLHDEPIDRAFIFRRVKEAVDYRRTFADLRSCRLIFAESDRLPALIVDSFGDVLVLQCLALGMERFKQDVVDALVEEVHPQGIYERSDVPVRRLEGLEQLTGVMYGTVPDRVEMVENGVHFWVDVKEGQKTGFFLDQKENRAAIAPFVKGKTVLDCFTHTGSFALNAAKGGAEHVTAVDVSESAIEMARANAARNGLEDKMDFLAADVFDLLPQLEAAHEKPYDFIILDPPAFTKSRRTANNAEKGYKEINLRAMRLLPRGGYLATASCSHFMPAERFERMLRSAAADAGVELRQIEARTQASDHPILWNVPETDYLKFYLFQVV